HDGAARRRGGEPHRGLEFTEVRQHHLLELVARYDARVMKAGKLGGQDLTRECGMSGRRIHEESRHKSTCPLFNLVLRKAEALSQPGDRVEAFRYVHGKQAERPEYFPLRFALGRLAERGMFGSVECSLSALLCLRREFSVADEDKAGTELLVP